MDDEELRKLTSRILRLSPESLWKLAMFCIHVANWKWNRNPDEEAIRRVESSIAEKP